MKGSHVTVIGAVPGGWSWACSCGIASFVTFFERRRAANSARWHRVRGTP